MTRLLKKIAVKTAIKRAPATKKIITKAPVRTILKKTLPKGNVIKNILTPKIPLLQRKLNGLNKGQVSVNNTIVEEPYYDQPEELMEEVYEEPQYSEELTKEIGYYDEDGNWVPIDEESETDFADQMKGEFWEGFSLRSKSKKEARAKKKSDKQERKNIKAQSKAEKRRAVGEAKLLRAEKGGAGVGESLLEAGKGLLGKSEEGIAEEEAPKSKTGLYIGIGIGAVVLVVILVLVLKKKK